MEKENIAENGSGGSVERSHTDGMLPDVALREKQSMLAPPPVSVEMDATVQYRDTIESFLDSIRERALQHMNDPNRLAAAIAV